jgi:hypothetical protein
MVAEWRDGKIAEEYIWTWRRAGIVQLGAQATAFPRAVKP